MGSSLAVYPKQGKAKVICYAGCNDALDILPALNMTVSDLFDDPTAVRTTTALDPHIQARIEARHNMNAPQRQLDNLIHAPDIGTRLVLAIAQIRPELYFAVKHDPDIGSNKVLLADPCGKHVAHLLGDAQ